MIEPLLISSSLLIGKEVMTQTITNSTKNIYSGIEKIMTNENMEFNQVLDNLDINTKLDIINSFIKEMESSNKLLSETTRKSLKYIENISMKYLDLNGEVTQKYPFNPNGSQNSCAGCISSNGRHLAMMPHPERTFLEWQWPDYEGNEIHNWTPWIKLFIKCRSASRFYTFRLNDAGNGWL